MLFVESARGLFIEACSDAAAARGIRPGIPLAEARGLCEGSSRNQAPVAPLIAEPSDPATDRAVLRQLALQCQTYSPIVGLEESDTPESLLLDITGCESHFGGEQGLARQLWTEFSASTYRTQIAVADTVGAAWAIAHFGVSNSSPIAVVPTGQHIGRLRTLPIAGLRLLPKILITLDKLDVRSIGQLEKLPRTTLPARFGKQLLQRLDQAWGTAHELITPETVQTRLSAVWNSEEAHANREFLEQIQRELLDQLLVKLLPQRTGIRELECRYSGTVDVVFFTLRLLQPSVDRRHLWDLLRLEWERQERGFQASPNRQPRCLTEGMTSIRLEISTTAPLKVRQQSLFDLEPDQKQAQAFRQFVERLSSRLGSQSVLRAQPIPEAQPEFSCDYCSWDEAASKFVTMESNAWERSLARSRPMWLLKCPEPLRVVSPVTFSPGAHSPPLNGSPRRVWWGTRQLQIARAWGPERIETGWWREQDVRRDYYRIETDQGQHLWIFQCQQTGDWFLHGCYE